MVATLEHWKRQTQLETAFNRWRYQLNTSSINYSKSSTLIKSYDSGYNNYSSTETKHLQLDFEEEPSPYSDRYTSFEADDFLEELNNNDEEGGASGFQSPEFAYEAALYNASDGLPMQLEDAMFSAWELQQSKQDTQPLPSSISIAADKKLGLMESLLSTTKTSGPSQKYQIVKESSQRMQQEDDDLSVGFELPP